MTKRSQNQALTNVEQILAAEVAQVAPTAQHLDLVWATKERA